MSFLSIYLDELGFFKYLASKALSKSSKNQTLLFIRLYLLISVLTIFTSNDIVILTFTPFICYFCKHSKILPFPYLISEFIAANTWSTFLLIGNPTNIYLSTFAGIKFFEYLRIMFIPTIAGGIISFAALYLIFRKYLNVEIQSENVEEKIQNKPLLCVALTSLVACIILLAISNYINIEMSYVSFVSFIICVLVSIIICIIRKINLKAIFNTFARLPYEIIPFLISMFVIVIGLENMGISKILSEYFNMINPLISYGIGSTIFSNIMNNIPMSVLFASLSSYSVNFNQAIYASIIGSNIGAFLTPIGALAGIMFTSLTSNNDVHISYFKFCKYGFLIAIPTSLAMLVSLSIII